MGLTVGRRSLIRALSNRFVVDSGEKNVRNVSGPMIISSKLSIMGGLTTSRRTGFFNVASGPPSVPYSCVLLGYVWRATFTAMIDP